MQVILKQEVKKLGKRGDVVNVAEGYARNYLFPRGLAVEASQGNLRTVKEERKAQVDRSDREELEAKETAKKLSSVQLTIPVKTGGKGKLFGSITSKDIAQALMDKNIRVDRKKIELSEPIKSLGTYSVVFRLCPGITATLKVNVVDASMEGDKE